MTTEEKRSAALADAEKKTNATAEQLWQEPPWNCRGCGWKNFAARSVCRNPKCRHRRDAQ